MIGPEAHSNGRTSFDIGSAEIGQVRELLQDVFPKSPKFEKSAAFLEWLYLSGPDGPAIWCDAMTEGRTVAHYGSVPQRYHSSAGDALLYLSLHSATHVGYRGRGTFSALAEATYGSQQAKTPYVVGAIGVPNREAAPPRTRRLGWTLYETLPLRVSLGLPVSFAKQTAGPALELVDDTLVLPDEFLTARPGWRQRWTREKLKWRASNPIEKIWLHRVGQTAAFVSVRKRLGLPVIAVIVKTFATEAGRPHDLRPLVSAIRARHAVTAVAHIGRNADVRMPGFDFPERWRPSPLTLGGRAFRPSAFDFTAIDCFEAWDYDLF